MVYLAGSGHIGGSFSATEIMTTLFFNVINHDSKNPKDSNRDRFVLSKGHASPIYYSMLARTGYFPIESLSTFRKINSPLQGHPDKSKLDIVETSSGSLGQGISIAEGIAFSLRLDALNSSILSNNSIAPNNFVSPKVYVLLGDGELNEGEVWEALATIKKHNLSNLIIIIDNNQIQLDGTNVEVKDLSPIENKLSAFGFEIIDVDGHSIEQLIEAFRVAKELSDSKKNVVLLARTVKGKGVSFMENTSKWHGRAPNKDEYDKALLELK